MRRLFIVIVLLLCLFVAVNFFDRKYQTIVLLQHTAPVIRIGHTKINFFPLEVKYLKTLGYSFHKISDYPTMDLNKGKNMFITFDDGYEDFYTDIYPVLTQNNIPATMYVIYHNIGKPGFMTKEEIQKIVESGSIELGSHSLDHTPLSAFVVEEQKRQIVESKKQLSSMFSYDVKAFSYPYGYFDKNSVDILNSSGYTTAVTADVYATTNPFIISRYEFNLVNIMTTL